MEPTKLLNNAKISDVIDSLRYMNILDDRCAVKHVELHIQLDHDEVRVARLGLYQAFKVLRNDQVIAFEIERDTNCKRCLDVDWHIVKTSSLEGSSIIRKYDIIGGFSIISSERGKGVPYPTFTNENYLLATTETSDKQ